MKKLLVWKIYTMRIPAVEQGDDLAVIAELLKDLPSSFPQIEAPAHISSGLDKARATLALFQVRQAHRVSSPAAVRISTPAISIHIERALPVTSPVPAIAPPPLALCKKSGASRSRRDHLASLVFVGEYLRETGVLPPRSGERASVVGVSLPSPPHKANNHLQALDRKIRTAPTIPGTTTKKPPTWRDLDDHAQAIFAFQGLRDRGPVTGFTVHLSDAVNDRAYAQGKPGPWLQKRLREQMDKAFGRAVDFLMSIEEIRPRTGERRLHIHGVIGLNLTSRRQADKARAAMRAAFGTWTGPGKQHQINFRHDIDHGWPSYIGKQARWATPSMRAFLASIGHTGLAPSFAGPVMSMTNGTTRLAKAAAGKARQIAIEARQRPAGASAASLTRRSAKPARMRLRRSAMISMRRHRRSRTIPFITISMRGSWHVRTAPVLAAKIMRPETIQRWAHQSTGPPRAINFDFPRSINVLRVGYDTKNR